MGNLVRRRTLNRFFQLFSFLDAPTPPGVKDSSAGFRTLGFGPAGFSVIYCGDAAEEIGKNTFGPGFSVMLTSVTTYSDTGPIPR